MKTAIRSFLARLGSTCSKDMVGFSAMIIALTALLLSGWQAREQRIYEKARMRPALRPLTVGEADEVGWYFLNDGLGPGYVQWLQVFVDGSPVKGLTELKQRLGIPAEYPLTGFTPIPVDQSYLATDPAHGYVVREGTRKPFAIANTRRGPIPSEVRQAFAEARSKVRFEMCTCSLFGECRELVWGEGIGSMKREIGTKCRVVPQEFYGRDEFEAW